MKQVLRSLIDSLNSFEFEGWNASNRARQERDAEDECWKVSRASSSCKTRGRKQQLPVCTNWTHSLRRRLAATPPTDGAASATLRLGNTLLRSEKASMRRQEKCVERGDNQKKKEKQNRESDACGVEQSLTIFRIAALEWLAAVEISSSASVRTSNTHTQVLAWSPKFRWLSESDL